jgi:hypothetical protein
MPVPLPARSRPLLRKYAREPWTLAARKSPALKRHCARHGFLTPNYRVQEMADTGTGFLPHPVRGAARRHCFNLERLRHALGDVAVRIDGPYRTHAHNVAVGGASLSRHVQGDASDHFAVTCDQIVKRSPRVNSKAELVALAETIFPGVGNENSGTLHLDSRPGAWVRFVTWNRSR